MVGNYEPGETMPSVAGILLRPFSLASMLDKIRRVLHASHAESCCPNRVAIDDIVLTQ